MFPSLTTWYSPHSRSSSRPMRSRPWTRTENRTFSAQSQSPKCSKTDPPSPKCCECLNPDGRRTAFPIRPAECRCADEIGRARWIWPSWWRHWTSRCSASANPAGSRAEPGRRPASTPCGRRECDACRNLMEVSDQWFLLLLFVLDSN